MRRKGLFHFKGVLEEIETPEEKKKRLQDEYRARYKKAVKRALNEEIWDFINKSDD